MVVVRGGDELLAGDKPRRFAVAELLGDFGQAEAKPSQLLDLGGVAGPDQPWSGRFELENRVLRCNGRELSVR